MLCVKSTCGTYWFLLTQEFFFELMLSMFSSNEFIKYGVKKVVATRNQLKIDEKLLLEKRKQQQDAIKRIQAWWRGTMARHIKQKRRKKKKK